MYLSRWRGVSKQRQQEKQNEKKISVSKKQQQPNGAACEGLSIRKENETELQKVERYRSLSSWTSHSTNS